MLSLRDLIGKTPNAVRKRAASQCSGTISAKDQGYAEKLRGKAAKFRELRFGISCTDGVRSVIMRFYDGGRVDQKSLVWVHCSCVAENTLIPTSGGIVPVTAASVHAVASLWTNEQPSGCTLVSKPAVAVTTAAGYRSVVSYDHLMLTLQPDLNIAWKRACDLHPDDYVAVQHSNLFAENPVSVPAWKAPDREVNPGGPLECLLCQGMYRNLGTHFRFKHPEIGGTDYRARFGNSLPLSSTKLPGPTAREWQLPQTVTPDLARVFGYIVSEGYVSRVFVGFSNSDENVVADYTQAWERCSNAPVVVESARRSKKAWSRKPGWNATVRSIQVSETFQALGVTRVLSGAKEVPWSILQSPRDVQVAFLQALFEGDGSAGAGHVKYHSKSEALVRQLQVMLLNMGILSSVNRFSGRTIWTMFIGGESATRFMTEIGFRTERKTRTFGAPARKRKNAERGRMIPFVPGRLLDAIGVARAYLVSPGLYDVSGTPVRIRTSDATIALSGSESISRERLGRLVPFVERIGLMDRVLPSQVGAVLGAAKTLWQRVESVDDVGVQNLVDLNDMPDAAYVGNGLVHHNCPYWTYYCEVAVASTGSSSIVTSNGQAPKIRNPSVTPYLCKHLYRAATEGLKAVREKGMEEGFDYQVGPKKDLREKAKRQTKQYIIPEDEREIPWAGNDFQASIDWSKPTLITVPDHLRERLGGPKK